MRIITALLALATAGCAVSFVEEEEFDAFAQDVDMKLAKLNDNWTMALHLNEEMVTKHGALQKKLTRMEMLLKAMESTLAKLEEDMKTALAAAHTGPVKAPEPGAGAAAVPEPPRRKTLEEILLEIATTLSQLRSGKLTVKEASVRLKLYASHASSRVLEEMENSLTDLDYSRKLETLLAGFPPAELKAPLRRGLSRNATRESAARVIGQTGDPELGKILVDHARTDDEDFKLAVGEGLVRCRQPLGLPLLIDCLRSQSSSTRLIAIDVLRRVNQGKDFGYRAPLPPDQNTTALKSWEEWHLKFGSRVFD